MLAKKCHRVMDGGGGLFLSEYSLSISTEFLCIKYYLFNGSVKPRIKDSNSPIKLTFKLSPPT